MNYAELSCKTNFSFLRGASHPNELVEKAQSLGLSALAINDYDGVYGLPKAFSAAKKLSFTLLSSACIKTPSGRIDLIARSKAGYATICKILTESHADKPKGNASIDWPQLEKFSGELVNVYTIANSDNDWGQLKKIFPDNKLYLGLAKYLDGLDKKRREKADWISRRWGVPIVAHNDVYYHDRERQPLQDVLTAIREEASLPDIGHKLFTNADRCLKSPEEMQSLFRDLPSAIEATNIIASDCSFCLSELSYKYPSEWIPSGEDADSYLEKLIWSGAVDRYKGKIPEGVSKQIKHELNLIRKKSYADYFLTIYDIVSFAKNKKILCQGRGSAANSVVCYCLGITAVDPVRMNLLFERFLSAERNEPPDIDVDFEHDRREEVLQYVYEKYGRHRAAMVSAIVTYKKRSAFREVAKALDIPVGTLSAKKIERDFSHLSKNARTNDPKYLVDEIVKQLSGVPRHLSIHSGGFTLSAEPLCEIVPIEPARMPGRTIIQWDKEDLDILGLLKVDLLSLGMLSAIRKTLELIGKELHEIPAEDAATYEMIQKAETVGTFQIESRAQMSMLGRLQPKTFYDLVIEVAIVRPGPIVGKMVHPYLRRRRGLEKVHYPHPKLRVILEKTLGVPLFQEQVMKMAIDLGGFSPGEADELRRAIGAWRSEGSIHKIGRKLVDGFRKSGLSEEFAERVYQQIQGFAQYGFPESHAASFALLAYVSCYLKRHYPAQFTCGLLNSMPMGFYAAHTLVDDAKRNGVKVLPIDVNQSDWLSKMETGNLRLGLSLVNGLSKSRAEEIISNRPYYSVLDFMQKCSPRTDLLERLALGDFFSSLRIGPREALWQSLAWRNWSNSSQMDLFFQSDYRINESQFALPKLSELEKIQGQYQSYSLSTVGHPLQALRRGKSKGTTKIAKQSKNGAIVEVSGLVLVRQRPPTAKGMTFSTLEDEFGIIDIAISPQSWADKKLREVFMQHCLLTVQGKLQKEGYSCSIMVRSIKPIITDSDRELSIEPTTYFW